MSWESLIGIARYGQKLLDEERGRAPQACPYDGTVLAQGDNGQLFCPFEEHYFWPQDGQVI
jgi:uncharacterized Zn finger protein (UPF0148 family)